MKSKPYKLNGKLFRYDFDHSMVEYIYKADAEDIALEEEWEKTTMTASMRSTLMDT